MEPEDFQGTSALVSHIGKPRVHLKTFYTRAPVQELTTCIYKTELVIEETQYEAIQNIQV